MFVFLFFKLNDEILFQPNIIVNKPRLQFHWLPFRRRPLQQPVSDFRAPNLNRLSNLVFKHTKKVPDIMSVNMFTKSLAHGLCIYFKPFFLTCYFELQPTTTLYLLHLKIAKENSSFFMNFLSSFLYFSFSQWYLLNLQNSNSYIPERYGHLKRNVLMMEQSSKYMQLVTGYY